MEDIRQYPCIYDKFDKDYSDKNAKNSAWSAIAAKYGITPMDADKKYKAMRSSYTRYLKRLRSTPVDEKPPSIPVAFVNLDWLASHIDHKETAASVVKATLNGGKSEAYYGEYPAEGDEAYHSSYGEIMREEQQHVSADVVESPSSSVVGRPRESLPPEPAPTNGHHASTARENLRPDPLPAPILHVNATECPATRVATPPKSNRVTSYQTPQPNSTKSITMYYNRPKVHESPSDTVLNFIPVESIQPSSSTSTPPPPPSEGFGKRRRVDYDDEDELFCLSLVPTLKRLGPRNKTIAKMRFQQVLFDLEFPPHD